MQQRFVFTTTVLVGLLALGARVSTQTDSRSGASGAIVARSADVQRDQDFIQFAAMSSLAEIELGRVAQQRAMNPEVKQFATQMIADHTQATEMLKQALGSAPTTTLPTQLDTKHREAMEKLQKMSGADFDRDYMRMMVDDHREAVDRFASAAGARTNETTTGPAPVRGADRASADDHSAGTVSESSRRGTDEQANAGSNNGGNSAATGSGASSAGRSVGTSGSSSSSGARSPHTVQDFAGMSLPILRTHLRMAEQIRSSLENASTAK